MHRRALLCTIAMLSAPLTTACVHAQQPQAASTQETETFDARARQLVDWLNGKVAADAYFSDYFLNAVPESQLADLRSGIEGQYGCALRVTEITAEDDVSGKLAILFETTDGRQSVGSFDLVVAPESPHKIVGLLSTGFTIADDSYAAIESEFAALPGEAGFAVARIAPDGLTMLAQHEARRQFAIGSTFKLYVLAELGAAIREGRTAWNAVVPLSAASLPSGVMQDWPKDMPVTNATLATMMISISDNSAADTLIGSLGRREIGARLAKIGHGDPDRALPFLTTLEAFALKMDANEGARIGFEAASEARQNDFLDRFGGTIERSSIRDVELTGAPRHIDTIEWFASPGDVLNLLAYLKRLDDPLLLSILGINDGIGKAASGKWQYLGYKGGSEPGVMNMSFLGRRSDGQWVAITGSWNDAGAPVDQTRFAALMSRLANLAAE